MGEFTSDPPSSCQRVDTALSRLNGSPLLCSNPSRKWFRSWHWTLLFVRYCLSLLSFFPALSSFRPGTVRSLRLCISLYCTVPSLASLPPSPACISGTVYCLSGHKSFLVSLLSVALRRYDITRERTKAGLRNNEKIISIPCILTNSPYSLISSVVPHRNDVSQWRKRIVMTE